MCNAAVVPWRYHILLCVAVSAHWCHHKGGCDKHPNLVESTGEPRGIHGSRCESWAHHLVGITRIPLGGDNVVAARLWLYRLSHISQHFTP